MVALAAPFGLFHLAQEGVHLFERETAVGAHRGVAGHGREQFVAMTGEHLARSIGLQILEDVACQRAGIGVVKQCRQRAYRQACLRQGCDLEPEGGEGVGIVGRGGDIQTIGVERHRYQ